MIPVDRVSKPLHFDRDVGTPGNDWLAANPDAKPEKFPDHWRHVRKDLEIGFSSLCGYSAIFTRPGTVDHYICKSSRHGRDLAYEWSNYRFASSLMNQRKGTWNARILDPFEVGHGWFEILLPNLEMVLVEERIPAERRDDVKFTLETLRLDDDEEVLEIRRHWYEMFSTGDLTLRRLDQNAPLIARAVRKRLDEIKVATLDASRRWFDQLLDSACTLATLRNEAPDLASDIDALLSRPDSRIRRRL